jgi:proprotein convertase subtilisin/kexin type 5
LKGCKTCDSVGQCLTCTDGNILIGSSCINNFCKKPTLYYDYNSNNCKSCNSPCLTCIDSITCVICQTPFYTYNSNCVLDCPLGFYKNNNTFQCFPCQSQCIMCNEPNNCLKCYNTQISNISSTINYVLHQGLCYLNCPQGTFMDTSKQKCLKCDDSCNDCYGESSAQCFSCAIGFSMDINSCLV